ncbi:MAG: helix-turn-helix domain-containing protein [Micrococcales bacterium]|nr:helix-turn-helix domain-containing protein [Micrococcales bacterium]
MSAATVNPVTLPPKDFRVVDDLARVLGEPAVTLVGSDGVAVEIPDEVRDVLVHVVDAMKQGQGITVAPLSTRLTTSQAAEFLGISRPTLVKLLEAHEIPFEKTTRHRRVRLDDVLAFRERRRVERRAALEEMSRQAIEDGLYEDTATDYRQALAEARKAEAG